MARHPKAGRQALTPLTFSAQVVPFPALVPRTLWQAGRWARSQVLGWAGSRALGGACFQDVELPLPGTRLAQEAVWGTRR